MRMTIHNARTSKRNGTFTPRHNDRNFDISHAKHIDTERTKDNIYWNWMNDPEVTFEDAEKAFYEKHIQAHLTAQNERYEAQRHPERVRTMDEYRKSPRTCPEETILMIGRKGDSIPPKTLRALCEDLRNWEENIIPGLKVLDIALHVDEEGAPHIHMRKAWIYRDENNVESISQGKALQAAGIPLPHPDKAAGRHNNRKQTFSAMERQAFFDICKKHGFESLIEMQPRERSRSGRELEDYKAEQAEQRAQIAEIRAQQMEQERDAARAERERIRKALTHARTRAERAQQRAQEQQAQNDALRAVEGQIRAQMEREQRMARQLAEMNERARRKLQHTNERLQELEPYLQTAERRQLAEIAQQQEREHEWTR